MKMDNGKHVMTFHIVNISTILLFLIKIAKSSWFSQIVDIIFFVKYLLTRKYLFCFSISCLETVNDLLTVSGS